MDHRRFRSLCLLVMLASSSAVAFADAMEQSQKSLAPRAMRVLAVVRKLQEQAGNATSLSPSEIDAVISRLEHMDPEAFAGRNDTELRNELASLDLSTFGLDPTSAGKLAAVTTDLLEGLNATQGSPGSAAPAPPDVALNITPFSPPDNCPGWSCVCADQPVHSKFPAPDNCQAFITCDGTGNGTKALCPIAGTGFDLKSGSCRPLDGPPESDTNCKFADTPNGVAASSFADTSNGTVSVSCMDLVALKESVNIMPTSVSGVVGCTLEDPVKSARMEVKASNSSMMLTTLMIKYMEKGPTTPITITSAQGAANITNFRPRRQTIRNRVSTNETVAAVQTTQEVWQPRIAMVPFTRLAGAAVVTIPRLQEGAGILILSIDVTEGLLPPPEMQVNPALDTDNEEDPKLGTEVAIPEGDSVRAMGWGTTLKTFANGKKWKSMMNALDAVGYINDKAGQLTEALDLDRYVKTYQNTLVGASQCYRHSYNRGAGHVPSNCHDWDNVAGICYERCRHNYYGVSFVCWENCPGVKKEWIVNNHCSAGLLAPMHSYWNSNNGCAWYDLCGTWARKWCRSCPQGYNRHGCVCTRPPRWHTKHTYTRSSRLPGCWPDRQMENGLCYTPCGTSYWGEAFLCYNECPDAFPHSCGIGVCAKDGYACGEFVKNAIISVVSLAASVFTTVATGGKGMASTLQAAVDTAKFFGETKSCSNSYIHLRSRMAVISVKDRNFQGNHIQAFDGTNWDGCLIRCRDTSNCKAVVFNHHIGRCHLMDRIGNGPHGSNSHAPGHETGVAVMRMTPESASWQFADGENIMFMGSIIPIPGTAQNIITHMAAGGGRNLALCQLFCIQHDCDFISYGDKVCLLMRRSGWPQIDTRILGAHSVMVNMQRWNDFDAGGNFPPGI